MSEVARRAANAILVANGYLPSQGKYHKPWDSGWSPANPAPIASKNAVTNTRIPTYSNFSGADAPVGTTNLQPTALNSPPRSAPTISSDKTAITSIHMPTYSKNSGADVPGVGIGSTAQPANASNSPPISNPKDYSLPPKNSSLSFITNTRIPTYSNLATSNPALKTPVLLPAQPPVPPLCRNFLTPNLLSILMGGENC